MKSGMRKVVCSCCGNDWQVQHFCRVAEFQGSAYVRPTVIWEPDEKGSQSDREFQLREVLEMEVIEYEKFLNDPAKVIEIREKARAAIIRRNV